MLTKNGRNNILRKILEQGGLNEELENHVEILKSDFEEKEKYLKNFGDVPDDEELEEFDYKINETSIDPEEDYKGKYNEMKQKYLDRFFGGLKEEVGDVKEEQKEDVKKDEEEQSFNDLFEEREG